MVFGEWEVLFGWGLCGGICWKVGLCGVGGSVGGFRLIVVMLGGFIVGFWVC